MKERQILYSGPMVRAVVAGHKLQTRRVINPQPAGMGLDAALDGAWLSKPFDGLLLPKVRDLPMHCPYGQPGDRLWVREAWRAPLAYELTAPRDIPPGTPIFYEADGCGSVPRFNAGKLRPGMFMPRWASRITLEVTGVRVERLQDISEADAVAEGVVELPMAALPPKSLWAAHATAGCELHAKSASGAYAKLWESINGPGSWDLNPWVWAISFQKVTP